MDYNLQMNPTSLSQLGKVPVDMTLEGMDWLSRAQANDNQTSADLPSLIAHEQRMRPMREQQLGISNDTSLAQLPGIKANSSMLGRKNKMEEITFDDDVKTKLSDLATKVKKNELEQIEMEAVRLMQSPNIEDQRKGARLLAASKHMFEENQKHSMNMEMEGLRHRFNMTRDRANQESRERIAGLKAEFDKAKALAKTPKDYQELGVRLSMQLQQTSDPAQRTMLEAQIEYANAMADRLRYQATPAPVIDPKIAPGVLVDPKKPIPAPPGASPTAAGGRVRVVGPDGRVGTIPSEQLQDALKSGYKEAK